MPKTKGAKKAMKNFQDQYGKKKGEQIYYATAKKQGRDEKSFKKESLKLLGDVVVETQVGMQIIPAGTIVTEMAVTTGDMAYVPTSAVGEPKKKKQFKLRKKEERRMRKELKPSDVGLEENSNSQVSPLQQDH